LKLLDTVGINAPGCLASFILTENTRRMTPHLFKFNVPLKSNSKTGFSSSQNENVCPFVPSLAENQKKSKI